MASTAVDVLRVLRALRRTWCTVHEGRRFTCERWRRLFACWLTRGLTFTFARVLVRAQVDGSGSQPIDREDPSHRSPCSHVHFGLVTIDKQTGLSPLARTCLHIKAHRFLSLKPFKSVAPSSPSGWDLIFATSTPIVASRCAPVTRHGCLLRRHGLGRVVEWLDDHSLAHRAYRAQ